MVIGRDFAWGHMGKTGGDAVWQMFQCVPDLIEFAHPPGDPEKHRNFLRMGVTDRKLVLNMRRLPSLVLSYVHHTFRYGLDATMPPGTWMGPEEACRFCRPERMIRNHTGNGRLPIHRWLRMESLRQDFLAWIATIRPLTPEEIHAILTVPTKPPMEYDHDPRSFFSAEQIATLYRVNPTWARHEREVYGDLPAEADLPAPEPCARPAPAPLRPSTPAAP